MVTTCDRDVNQDRALLDIISSPVCMGKFPEPFSQTRSRIPTSKLELKPCTSPHNLEEKPEWFFCSSSSDEHFSHLFTRSLRRLYGKCGAATCVWDQIASAFKDKNEGGGGEKETGMFVNYQYCFTLHNDFL